MSTSTSRVARSSMAAALQAAGVVPPAPAPITKLAPESDKAGKAKLKAASAKPAASVDQATVDNWLTALRGSSDAALALFLACITRKVQPAQFVGFTEGSQKKTASIFNSAGKHAALFGAAFTRRVITKAAAETGDVRLNVYTTLAKQNATGHEMKASGLSGAALAKAVEAKAAQAVADVKKADVERQKARSNASAKASAERATRVPAMPKGGTLDAFAPMALLALKDLREQFGKLAKLPASAQKYAKDFESALSDAFDALTAMNDR